ncbi:MAG: YgfZ/GcvT domain-containing protein [Acidobacteriota bacterium]
MQGYQSLRTAAAWRDTSSRGRILAHGEDNARLLHAMCSNHIQGLNDGQGCYAFFLSAQGRIQTDAHILKCGASFLIDTEASTHALLLAHLDKFIIADDVTLEDLATSHYEIAFEGPGALDSAAAHSIPVPSEAYGVFPCQGGYIARLNETGFDGLRFILPLSVPRPGFLAEYPEADLDAWETVRREQGKPRFGVEILDRHLIQETRLLHGVHFKKGCYLGQEIVERVRARGAVHKGLAALTIETSEVPSVPADLCGGGDQAGQLLGVSYSPAEGKCVGIALLGIDYLKGGKHLTCNGHLATLRASSAFATL